MAKEIDVLLVEPGRLPRPAVIENNLKSMQNMVGGYIEVVYPFDNPNDILVCNEEGKIMGLPANRPLRNDAGQIYDIVHGTFFIVGSRGEDFASLNRDQMMDYTQMFSQEMILERKPRQNRHH